MRERLTRDHDLRDKALRRWRGHVSTVHALFTWSGDELVDIWRSVALLDGKNALVRPYRAALDCPGRWYSRRSDACWRAGVFYWLMEDFMEAYDTWMKLLTMEEELLGFDHPDVADTLNSLGSCALKAGRTEEAETRLRRALAIRNDKLGKCHPAVARTLHELRKCLMMAGQTEEAKRLYEEALGIRQKLGADRPGVGCTLHWLGVCAAKAWQTEEADMRFRHALNIKQEIRRARLSVQSSTQRREVAPREDAEGVVGEL